MTTTSRKGPKRSAERQLVETRFDEVEHLRAQGKTVKEIALFLGVNVYNLNTVLALRGKRLPLKGVPEEKREAVKQMYLSGMLPRQISQELNVPARTIQVFVYKHLRLKHPETPKPRVFGKNNPAWKGGHKRFRKGYAYVPNGELDPRGRALYVPEHRFLMEKHLGRKLLSSEVVHHMNGDHTDNRIENLMLFPTNADHLRHELSGKCPNWTAEGKSRILAAVRNRKATFQKHSTGSASVQLGQLLLPL